MKKKGQALVEFIIILPIFIMLVLGVIDIGNIISSKITLESQISDITTLYKKGKSIEEIKKDLAFNDYYKVTIEEDKEYIKIELTKKIDIITPGLQLILDNPYHLSITRSVLNE